MFIQMEIKLCNLIKCLQFNVTSTVIPQFSPKRKTRNVHEKLMWKLFCQATKWKTELSGGRRNIEEIMLLRVEEAYKSFTVVVVVFFFFCCRNTVNKFPRKHYIFFNHFCCSFEMSIFHDINNVLKGNIESFIIVQGKLKKLT